MRKILYPDKATDEELKARFEELLNHIAPVNDAEVCAVMEELLEVHRELTLRERQ